MASCSVAMDTFQITIIIILVLIININPSSSINDDISCFQVIDAYSNTSQLNTLCVDNTKFDIVEIPQTCSECNNDFYGNIANSIDLNYLWVLITGALVFFMQTGFTMFS